MELSQNVMYVLAALVTLSAAALFGQLILMMMIFLAVRRVRAELGEVSRVIAEKARATAEIGAQAKEIAGKAKGLQEKSLAQWDQVRALGRELSGRGKAQAERLKLMREDTRTRMNESLAIVRRPWQTYQTMAATVKSVTGNGAGQDRD